MAGVFDSLTAWFYALLFRLGFYNKEATVVVIGLDNAGKTTLLHKLMTGRVSSFTPTERAHEEKFTLGGVDFRAWDLGGHESVRHLWEDFMPGSHGLVFMVDAADEARLEEAADELHEVLGMQAVTEFRTPVAVLLNKADLLTALPDAVLIERLSLTPAGGERSLTEAEGVYKVRSASTEAAEAAETGTAAGPARDLVVRTFRCSVLRNSGYEEALRWIAEHIPATGG